jgi:hypothetical protein
MPGASFTDKNLRNNLVTYAVFILITVAGSIYGHAISDDHSFLRVWNYQNILLLLLAVPFLFLQGRAGIPAFWEAGISKRQRWLLPLLYGAAFGILDVIVIKIIQHPEPYSELPPFLQPFPYSLFLFFAGALEIEVFYRLMPLTIILLVGKWYAGGKYLEIFFWAGAVLTSLREPLEQMPSGALPLIIYSLTTGFLMNFLQAVHFRRSGFLASLAVRLGHYLFWHILLGIYVQYIEL